MAVTRVQVVNEVKYQPNRNGPALCLQYCRYVYSNGELEEGYRFIWRDADGKQMAHRGQARIPSLKIVKKLIEEAEKAGWGTKEFK